MIKVIAIGEILWDVFPTYKVWGGAPANAIFYAQQLGCDATMFSAIGQDDLGEELTQAISELGFKYWVERLSDYPTGMVDITLDSKGNASYEIVEASAWDYISLSESLLQGAREADLIIIGTLAQRSALSRETIRQAINQKKAGAKVLCDLNLRQNFYSKELIETSLEMSHFLKINEEELSVLENMFQCDLQSIIKEFNWDLVILTRGEKGSSIYYQDKCLKQAAIPGELIDTVGAGDSFTACFIIHFLSGADVSAAQMKASRLASYVCAHSGATQVIPEELKVID